MQKNVIYFVLIAGILLLIFNISILDFNHLEAKSFVEIGSNILIIIAMVLTLRNPEKVKNK